MGQITYADVLEFLGLSNWQFIALALVVLFAWATLSTLWKVGGINKVKVAKKMIPSFHALYISFEGSYDSIGIIYNQSVEDFQMVFKFSNYFAIYYTLSNEVDLASKAVIGIAINKLEVSKIPLFLSKFPMYRECKFPETSSLSATYPLINSASSMMVIKHVYPVIEQKLKQLNIDKKKKHIMEIYHVQSGNPYMDIIYPIENEDSFELWYEPTDYSRVFSKKTE